MRRVKYGLLDAVPVIRLAHLSPEQVRAYRIADNRLSELSGWDDELLAAELQALDAAGFDLGLTGFEGEDLDLIATDGAPVSVRVELTDDGVLAGPTDALMDFLRSVGLR